MFLTYLSDNLTIFKPQYKGLQGDRDGEKAVRTPTKQLTMEKKKKKHKNLPASAKDTGLILHLGKSLGEGNGNLLQYPCLENPMDRGTWWAIVHGVAKSQT